MIKLSVLKIMTAITALGGVSAVGAYFGGLFTAEPQLAPVLKMTNSWTKVSRQIDVTLTITDTTNNSTPPSKTTKVTTRAQLRELVKEHNLKFILCEEDTALENFVVSGGTRSPLALKCLANVTKAASSSTDGSTSQATSTNT